MQIIPVKNRWPLILFGCDSVKKRTVKNVIGTLKPMCNTVQLTLYIEKKTYKKEPLKI